MSNSTAVTQMLQRAHVTLNSRAELDIGVFTKEQVIEGVTYQVGSVIFLQRGFKCYTAYTRRVRNIFRVSDTVAWGFLVVIAKDTSVWERLYNPIVANIHSTPEGSPEYDKDDVLPLLFESTKDYNGYINLPVNVSKYFSKSVSMDKPSIMFGMIKQGAYTVQQVSPYLYVLHDGKVIHAALVTRGVLAIVDFGIDASLIKSYAGLPLRVYGTKLQYFHKLVKLDVKGNRYLLLQDLIPNKFHIKPIVGSKGVISTVDLFDSRFISHNYLSNMLNCITDVYSNDPLVMWLIGSVKRYGIGVATTCPKELLAIFKPIFIANGMPYLSDI